MNYQALLILGLEEEPYLVPSLSLDDLDLSLFAYICVDSCVSLEASLTSIQEDFDLQKYPFHGYIPFMDFSMC